MSPTIKDIAEAAGVSKATVSYVLNNRPGVSEATRQRILRIMKEMRYSPSTPARNLASGRTDAIGLVIPDISDVFYTNIVRGVEHAANEHDLILNLATTRGTAPREERAAELMTSGRVDGLILMTYHLSPAQLTGLLGRVGHAVLLDETDPPAGFQAVAVDNMAAGYQATSYLLERGHRRIAYIHGSLDSRDTWERFRGYRRALAEYAICPVDDYILVGGFRRDGGYQAACELVQQEPRPTAVFAANDQMAIGCILGFQDAGLAVPDDVSVIGVDNIPATELVKPQVTTIEQPTYEMGRIALELLVRSLKEPGSPRGRQTLPVKLIERESCRSL